jgi:GDPmannose 4,6-dehydratase
MIFHFGAIHGAAGFQYEPLWRKALEVNTASVHAVLEYARNSGKDPTLVYASSSKIFGDPLSGVIAEDSPRRMTCPYSITKLAAEGIIRHYRDRHKIKAGILNLFNHESPRRSSAFFFPKLARELNACLADGKHLFEVDTLDFFCDWGSAEEYMKLAVMAAEKAPGEDFIIATGATWLGRDFVNQMWRRFGLDASRHVRERRTIEGRPPFYRASLEKLSRRLGLTPKIGALDVCEAMAKHAGKQGFQ